jgi:hypothetical protein
MTQDDTSNTNEVVDQAASFQQMLDDAMTTKEAAEALGMKDGQLLSYVRKYPALRPLQRGKMLFWTLGNVEAIKIHRDAAAKLKAKIAEARAKKLCLHCGKKPW